MNDTGINWCDKTWNPMTGCLHGCDYCYARKLAETRLKAMGLYPQGFKPTFHNKRLYDPVDKPGAVIFVGSMTDMMGAWWPNDDINAVIETCYQEKQHTFLWLSKNPGRYADFIWPDNCWLGMTLTGREDDNLAGLRAFILTPNIKRFLSIEPMLGPVNLTGLKCNRPEHQGTFRGHSNCPDCHGLAKSKIHQVILGPQTGADKLPMKESWAEDVKLICDSSSIPFFRKDLNKGQLAWR